MYFGFKPCSNWNTFNTKEEATEYFLKEIFVLNLVLIGIPSIPSLGFETRWSGSNGFKPYYNWNTFDTPS